MWKPQNLNLFVDVTTRCNVGCPMCHRTNPMGCNTTDWLPTIDWSIEQFKKAYPIDVCERVSNFNICGTWGDPIVNKDILQIVAYIRDANVESTIMINTNGSLRSEDFWWELGKIGGRNLTVMFAVEGITQEMHELYRQKSFLKKVLNNMEVLSQTPAKCNTQTILFDHNINYLDDIKEMCKQHGSTQHSTVSTDRFESNNEFKFIDARGVSQILKKPINNNPEKKSSHSTDQIEIVCKWAKDNRIVINPDGQVLPCCYLCNPFFTYDQTHSNRFNYFINHELIKKYKRDEFNVFNRNLLEIIRDPWFQNDLSNSFTSNKPLNACLGNCSNVRTKHNVRVRTKI